MHMCVLYGGVGGGAPDVIRSSQRRGGGEGEGGGRSDVNAALNEGVAVKSWRRKGSHCVSVLL
jgi:hypothetical protein